MNRKLPMILLVVALCTAMALPVAAREFADIYTECGLGAMIAPNTPVVAVITNITWDLGTTAISSNISSPESCKGGQEKVAAFIFDAYDDIAADVARGEGAYLGMMLELAGDEATSNGDLVESLRQGLATAVAAPDYSNMTRFDKAEALYKLVYANTQG